MKRKSLLFLMLMALFTPWAAKAQTLDIDSQLKWNTFASNPNSYSVVNLNTDNVTVDKDHMVNGFSGTFNGQGHTLNVSIGTSSSRVSSQGAAPFQSISGATIKNLTVTGSVYASKEHASGLVGFTNSGNNTIQNCLVSTNVYSTSSHAGGILGHGKSVATTLDGCVFNGYITAAGGNQWFVGGLVGWCDGGASFSMQYCLFDGTFDHSSIVNFHPIGCKDSNASISLSLTHCYYTVDIYSTCTLGWALISANGFMNNNSAYCLPYGKSNKGKFARTVTLTASPTAGGTVSLGNITGTYSVSGITAYGTGIKYNDTFYAGSGDVLSVTATANAGYEFSGWNGGSTDNPINYTMTNDNASFTANFGLTNPYTIASVEDWDAFCAAVNGGHDYYGETVKLANNITVGSQNTPITSTDYMVGNINHPFRGTFNGQNHKLTIYLSSDEEGCAPFHYINGATIQNLEVAGKVTATSHHAGGLVGFAGNTAPHYNDAPLQVYNTIYNCHVSTDVTNNSGNFIGGIIGHNKNVCTTIEGCVYDGKLTSTGYKGGMIGWSDRSTLTVNNSCFGGDYSTSNNFSPIGCKTHTQNDNPVSLVLTFNNFYYNKDAGTFDNNDYNAMTGASVTGAAKHAYTVTGSGANVALSGTPNEYSVSGITSYTSNKGLLYNGTIIAGESDNVALALNGSPTGLYQANHGTLTASGAAWILAMAAYDTEISVLPFTKTIEAYGTSERGGYYLIASPLAAAIAPTNVDGMITDELGSTATTSTGTYDLYSFNQAQELEWQNYRASNFNLVNGTGYLYASKGGTTLTFSGAPYSGDTKTVTLSMTAAAAGLDFPTWNLVGNPFAVDDAYITKSFYTLENSDAYTVNTAGTAIHPMQGLFVVAENNNESLTFSKTPNREVASLNMNVSKVATRGVSAGSSNVVDQAIISFTEGQELPKLQFRNGSTKVYLPKDGKEYAIVSAKSMGTMPVNFKAEDNGTYTLDFTTKEVSFNYLHLIDNMNGNDVDLLQTPYYTFDAKSTDYASRFTLVFATGSSTGSDNFAFFNNGVWIINNPSTGSGDNATLQVVDALGRILSSETISGSCSKAINVATGVYMLRLINGNDVKVQKIVVR